MDESAARRARLVPLSTAELDWIADAVGGERAEGYPAAGDRLRLTSPGLRVEGTDLYVPDGPWHVRDHPNRRTAEPDDLDPEVPTADRSNLQPDLVARWRAEGLAVDQHGRPVHPHWRQLLADPRIGLPTGVGYFWRYGPNATVDPVIYRRRGRGPVQILLIRRRVGGRWALPGGFRDRADATAEDAARREAAEETGLVAIGGRAEIIAQTRSINPIVTLHAWPENTLVLIHGDQQYLADTAPAPGDDAVDALWASPTDLDGLQLFDLHRQHISTALEHITRAGDMTSVDA